MNRTSSKKITKQIEREIVFFNDWANSEDIEETNIHQMFNSMVAMENEFILKQMKNLRGKKILDVGCGLGESAVYFALRGAKVTAVDVSPEMISFAKQLALRHKVNINFIVSAAEHLRLEPNFFDFIYCANLIHHISVGDRNLFIKKMHRILKKEGWFYSIDPLAYNPVINVYRRMANSVRSYDEKPLRFQILEDFKQTFSKTYHREFWFLTLVLFLKYFFLNRYNPNKIKYWREIYKEKPESIGWWFNGLKKVDKFLLRIPFLKRFAWNIVIYAQK